MAKKKMPAAAAAAGPAMPATIEADAFYDVKLCRAVKHGPTWLRPGAARIRLSGATVEELGDAVVSAVKVK